MKSGLVYKYGLKEEERGREGLGVAPQWGKRKRMDGGSLKKFKFRRGTGRK